MSFTDNTTVVAEPSAAHNHPVKDMPQTSAKGHQPTGTASAYFASDSQEDTTTDRPFYVPIDKHGVITALRKLDSQLTQSGHDSILSQRKPVAWTGHEVSPGNIGLINNGGCPNILTQFGRYPGFPWKLWWTEKFCGTRGLSDTVIEFQGLTIVQVSQNQVAVVSDPQNRIFIIRNSGFVAYGVEGSYDILSIVDQTHLPNLIKDPVTKVSLGHTFEVKMKSALGRDSKDYVVALFFDIPANNCAILQKGNELVLMLAGQHCVTNPEITLRGLYTLGENQLELPTKDIYTRDQVPVSLTIYLKWQLLEPLKLCSHGYSTPYEALRDKTQSILTQIVSHLDYSSIIKQRSLGPSNLDDGTEPDIAFLDALRTRAMDDLTLAASQYGIELRDLAVVDRQFKGEVAVTMDKLTTRALHAQVEAANVDRENSNKIKQEEGALSVARIAAKARNAVADSEAYAIVATAKAQAERMKVEAEAAAAVTRIAAEAEAEGTRVKAKAYKEVEESSSKLAVEMELRRMEVAKVNAFGSKTIFVPSEGLGAQMGSSLATGLAAGLGSKM